MLIFIDESGIHKKVDHSTFALAYIEAKDYSATEKEIQKIEKELKIDYFHWAETVWKVKEKFIKSVLKLDFKAKIAVVRNPVNPSLEMERVLSHMIIEKNIRNIFIDGKKPKWYAGKIKKVLRDKGISVKKLKTVKSNQYAGARIADMIAGLVRSHFDKKNEEKLAAFYQQLKKKIIIILE